MPEHGHVGPRWAGAWRALKIYPALGTLQRPRAHVAWLRRRRARMRPHLLPHAWALRVMCGLEPDQSSVQMRG